MIDEGVVQVLNGLTLAAAALIACGVLWRAYKGEVESHITDLRNFNSGQLQELRARLMVVEDNLHIQRVDRYEYMPDAVLPGAKDLEKLGKN